MSTVTENVSEYIRQKGINLTKLSKETGIPYMSLYKSMAESNKKRTLRDEEFLRICGFLGVNPMDFAE